jgi:hypothetical protein
MTINQELLEVSARLEEVALRMPGTPSNAEEVYERLELTAISILDSEHENWPEGVLCGHLTDYLSEKRRELGLEPF